MKDFSKWESYEALLECIKSDSKAVARAVNQSLSLVFKWHQEPATEDDLTHSGTRNPLDRLHSIISTIEKKDIKRAYIPIYWLCSQFKLSTPFPLPKVHTVRDINKALLAWTMEFGETCKEASLALEDGEVTAIEYKNIHRELMEDMAAGMALLEAIKQKHENER